MRVPFVGLGPSCRPLNGAILADMADLFESTRFHYGMQVAEFEERFASYCGAAHGVGMSSGLDALRLALLAAGIEPSDEVIVPANTFIATFAAVHQAGGIPVPVDASEADYNLDPALVAQAVTDRTLSTAAGSGTSRGSARSWRSRRAPSSAHVARFRAIRSSAPASRSATRSSSATA